VYMSCYRRGENLIARRTQIRTGGEPTLPEPSSSCAYFAGCSACAILSTSHTSAFAP